MTLPEGLCNFRLRLRSAIARNTVSSISLEADEVEELGDRLDLTSQGVGLCGQLLKEQVKPVMKLKQWHKSLLSQTVAVLVRLYAAILGLA